MHSSLARPHLAIFTPGSNNRLGILCFSSFIIIAATPLASLQQQQQVYTHDDVFIYLYLLMDLFLFSGRGAHTHTPTKHRRAAAQHRTSYTLVCCLPGARDL
jgi:hypothetical protein